MKRSVVFALALLAIAAPAYTQDSLEAIEKAVSEKWDQLQSFSGLFDLTASFKLKPEQTTPMNLVGGGNIDYAKSGTIPKYKAYLWTGFSPTGRLLQAQAVYDGQAGFYEALAPMFQLNKSGQATMDDLVQPGGKPLFDAMRKHLANLTACPSENVGGADCYVVKASAKEAGGPVTGFKVWLAKATGIAYKVALSDPAGVEVGVVTMKEIKVDGPVNGDLFKFVSLAPPAPPAAAAAPAPAPAAK